MAINTLFQISGVTYSPRSIQVNRTMSEFGASSHFTADFDSPFGRHNNDFTVGNEVVIRADKDNTPAGSLIFTGILENISFAGEENTQSLFLRGRDYTARLMDTTVEPVVYTNSEVSTIVTNIITNEVSNITTNGVAITTTTLPRISFNHQSVFDALTQLAELSNFIFYVGPGSDLNFIRRNSSGLNITFNNTNVISSRFDTDRENFANKVWVYGDRQLTAAKEIQNSGSPGSVYTLTYRPHNTQVEISNWIGSVLRGGIFQQVGPNTSGPHYLVNFEDRQIIFRSGTDLGYTSLPNTGSVTVTYQRDVPIVKYGQNNISITAFGPKEKVIIDKNIKDPNTARNILIAELDNSLPLDKIELTLGSWYELIPGRTVTVNLPDFNLSGNVVGILEVNYDFNPITVQTEDVLSVSLDNKIGDITDEIVKLHRRLNKLEAGDTQDTDLITRLEFSTGSLLVVGSKFIVYTRYVGSSFILGDLSMGSVLTGANPGPVRLGLLGSSTGSVSYLGDSRSGLSFVTSGGYIY